MATPRTGNPRGRPRKDRDNYVDRCARRYDEAQRREAERSFIGRQEQTLYTATGDPLARDNEAKAREVYELDKAKRPSRYLAEIHLLTWGGTLESVVDFADAFGRNIGAPDRGKSENLPCTRRELIADAIATLAERGTFIGGLAPVSFSTAIRATFAFIKERANIDRRRAALGDTGQTIKVRPPFDGAVVFDPATWRQIPAEGAIVPDNAFWRRLIDEGSVIKI